MRFPAVLLALGLTMIGSLKSEGAETGGFNVRDFGAVGDGKTLDSPAINRAVEAAAHAGGGTVWLPAGRYLSGSIRLRSRINLHLDAGAVLVAAPQSMNAYDETEPWDTIAHQDGGHVYFHNSLIWGENLDHVSITGQGMIDGAPGHGGLVSRDAILDEMCGFTIWEKPGAVLPQMPPVRLGNKAIALKLCRNVLIRDITIFHGGHFAILATGCDNLTIDNVTADTDRDGIDIDCCRNVMVSNCRVNAPFDDAICPKSTFALGRPVLTENLMIVNCQVTAFAEGTLLDGTMKPVAGRNGRIKFGTESSGGYRNCVVSNCTFRNCKGLALEEVDGGLMENISIDNITMIDVADYPIYLVTGSRNRTPGVTTPSRMRNISISNIVATGVDPLSGIQITGLPGQPIEDVRLDNIRLVFKGGGTAEDARRVVPELGARYPEPARTTGRMPAYGVFARHVRGLELSNLRLSFEQEDRRPAIHCEDIDGLDILNFKAQVAAGVNAGKFEDVKALKITGSPVLE
ncbi:MAG TPA: glycoside hydrolase family 28 protein [Rariglobus sp.]|jgi:polygalacturonase|nr:glycoside hydrolase family 28 protein [Rariglobus sp.]